MKYQATSKVQRRMALMAFQTEYRYGKPHRQTKMIFVEPEGVTEDTDWDLSSWVQDGYVVPVPEPVPVPLPVPEPDPEPDPVLKSDPEEVPTVETVAPPEPSPPGQRVWDSKPSEMRNIKPNLGATATDPVPLEGMEDGLSDMGFKVAVTSAPVADPAIEELIVETKELLAEAFSPKGDAPVVEEVAPEPETVAEAPKPRPRVKRAKVSAKRQKKAKKARQAAKEVTDEG